MKAAWRSVPLHALVLAILELKGGTLTDREVYEAVRSVHDVSYAELLKALMKLELNGKVRVYSVKEGSLIVELVKSS